MKFLYMIAGLFLFFIEFIVYIIKGINLKNKINGVIVTITVALIIISYINFSLFVALIIGIFIVGIILYALEEKNSKIMICMYKSIILSFIYLIFVVLYDNNSIKKVNIESNKNDYILVKINEKNHTLIVPDECMKYNRVDVIYRKPAINFLPSLELYSIGCKNDI